MRLCLITILCGMFALAACGDDETTGADAGTTDSVAADTTAGDTTPSGVELTNTLTINDWISGAAIEGVELCYIIEGAEGSLNDCAMTDAEGNVSFTATVYDGDLVEARADKEGYFPFLVQGVLDQPVGGELASTWVIASADSLGLLTSVLGAEINADKGHTTVVVWGPADADGLRSPLIGATVELAGAAEFGPNYLNPADEFATAGPFADAAGGITSSGLAAFFNVDPSTVDVTVTAEGHVCVPGLSGLPSESGTLGGKVEAGLVSYLVAFCDVAP
jgi:hypothetical protein